MPAHRRPLIFTGQAPPARRALSGPSTCSSLSRLDLVLPAGSPTAPQSPSNVCSQPAKRYLGLLSRVLPHRCLERRIIIPSRHGGRSRAPLIVARTNSGAVLVQQSRAAYQEQAATKNNPQQKKPGRVHSYVLDLEGDREREKEKKKGHSQSSVRFLLAYRNANLQAQPSPMFSLAACPACPLKTIA